MALYAEMMMRCACVDCETMSCEAMLVVLCSCIEREMVVLMMVCAHVGMAVVVWCAHVGHVMVVVASTRAKWLKLGSGLIGVKSLSFHQH